MQFTRIDPRQAREQRRGLLLQLERIAAKQRQRARHAALGGLSGLHQRLPDVNVYRAARQGLTVNEADRWAIRLGYMPQEIWDDWYDHETVVA